MNAAEFEAAGLYDPGAPDAADRLALLEWLAARGITIEQMVRSQREGSLTGLAGDLTLQPGKRLTLRELAAQMGGTPAGIAAVRLAAGLPPVHPDEPTFSEGDARSFSAFAAGASQFGERASLRFARVIGSGLARIADAAVSLFIVNVETPIRESRAGHLALAKANLRAMETLEVIPVAMEVLFRAHVETAIRRFRQARRGEPSADTLHLTVGFVDLVGFTTLSRRMGARELADVIDRFEDTANEVATARDGRVVKLIGDEVMFVTVQAAAACDIALTLVEHFARDPSVTPRGGLAVGNLLWRGGDYYGPIVNLASRLAELAVPRELLVTAEVAAEAAANGMRFAPAGKRLLKGFEEPVTLFAVERA
jgi:class 3 adenylate cyclase